MKLEPVRFQTAFMQKARQPLATSAPADRVVASEPQPGFLKRLFFGGPKPQVPPQQPLALSAALPGLAPGAAVALAQQVALEQITVADEEQVGKDFRASCTPASQERVQALWAQLAPYIDLEAPLAVDKPIGPGYFRGRSLFANPAEVEKLPEPVALFFLAHEAGHVAHRDSARKQGQQTLLQLAPPQFLTQLQGEVQQGDRAMEFAADHFAAGVVAKLGCDPEPILEELLTLASGPQHPDGFARAAAVREALAEAGVAVSEERWQALVERTAGRREANQRSADEAQEWLSSMNDLR